MSNIISVTDFRNHVSDIVNRVHYKNETIFLTRGNTVVAKIVGVEPSYPYARQIKAARVKAGSFAQVAAHDLTKLMVRATKKFGAFIKFLTLKVRQLILLLAVMLKRWVGICFLMEKESWMVGVAGTKRRRAV